MKKGRIVRKVLMAIALACAAGAAAAQPIPLTNGRPVTVNNSAEPTLQSILDGLFGASWGSVLANQSPFGLWRSATSAATTIPTIVAEFAANAPINRFGIWFGTDASNIFTYDLLLGPSTVGTNAAISILNGSMTVGSSNIADCSVLGGGKVNCGSATNALITPDRFGFYFQTGSGNRAFSIDALNPGSAPRVLSFQQGSTTNWALAYEDAGDWDFNDMVVKIESIAPVPEASTLALMLSGLGVVALAARRRSSKVKAA
jgi:hypothetical protein